MVYNNLATVGHAPVRLWRVHIGHITMQKVVVMLLKKISFQ